MTDTAKVRAIDGSQALDWHKLRRGYAVPSHHPHIKTHVLVPRFTSGYSEVTVRVVGQYTDFDGYEGISLSHIIPEKHLYGHISGVVEDLYCEIDHSWDEFMQAMPQGAHLLAQEASDAWAKYIQPALDVFEPAWAAIHRAEAFEDYLAKYAARPLSIPSSSDRDADLSRKAFDLVRKFRETQP